VGYGGLGEGGGGAVPVMLVDGLMGWVGWGDGLGLGAGVAVCLGGFLICFVEGGMVTVVVVVLANKAVA